MNTPKHTPGPWKWLAGGPLGQLIGPQGEPVLTVTAFERFPQIVVREWEWDGPPYALVPLHADHPDARLIAAAPALFANLNFAVWCLENPGVPPTPDALANMKAALALCDAPKGGAR